MKESLINFLEPLGLTWWVEIITENPRCTYYFGPFLSSKEAELSKSGYLEDLQQEGAEAVDITIKRCKPPAILTIYDESLDLNGSKPPAPVFSGQM
jgi:hypothetical protein